MKELLFLSIYMNNGFLTITPYKNTYYVIIVENSLIENCPVLKLFLSKSGFCPEGSGGGGVGAPHPASSLSEKGLPN